MRQSIILFIGLLFTAQIFAQEKEDLVMINRPFQLSFIYPLSTNGLQAGRVSNNFSINILGGFNGGLKGVEFGGLYNVIKKDTYGAQFAGLGNVVAGTAHGAQFGGLFNISANGMNAVQFAGLINVSTRESNGGQVAGLVNVATGNMKGAQIGGLVNFARKLNGLQLGFVNIADTVESGIPIGFLSIVRKGYFRIEAGATETLFGTASLKIGVSRFYNIFSVGVRPEGDQFKWAFGYGVGTKIQTKEKLSFNIDAVSYQINEGRFFRDDNNLHLLNKLSTTFGYHINSQMTLYAGVSANVIVANNFDSRGELRESIAPWAPFDEIYGNTRVQIYPGLHAGIRL